MSIFATLFGRDAVTAPLPLNVERDAILAAREGDDDAFLLLAKQYSPALRRAVRDHGGSHWAREELEQAALLGFAEAIRNCQGNRLAGIVRQYLAEAVSEVAVSYAALHIPARTVKRFAGLVRTARTELGEDADRDHVLDWAEGLAEGAGMTRETFRAVRSARYSYSNDVFADYGIDPVTYEEEAFAACESEFALVETAFDALTGDELAVVRLAYGFSDYDPVTDAEIGQRLGMSRSKVQQLRTRALEKMRDVLGLYEDDIAA